MALIVVVPLKKGWAKGARIFNRTKLLGNQRLLLEGFALSVGIRIVIRHMGTRMSLGHTAIGPQQGNCFCSHGSASIRMEGQLCGLNLLLLDGLFNQSFCQGCGFSVSYHPAHHVATEDIEEDIKREVSPLGRSIKFRHGPRPPLGCPSCQPCGLVVGGMA